MVMEMDSLVTPSNKPVPIGAGISISYYIVNAHKKAHKINSI